MTNPEQIARVAELTDRYTPCDETLELTHGIDIVTVSGPTGAGKDTVIRLTGLPIVTGQTSREERAQDNGKFSYIETPEDWDEVIDNLEARRYVQAQLHPKTHNFYGSMPSDYHANTLNIIDVLPQQYRDFKRDGLFGSVRPVYITPPGFGELLRRINNRGPIDQEDFIKRMKEGKDSIATTIGDDEFYYVLNVSSADAARQVSAFALRGNRDARGDRAGRSAARTILEVMQADPRFR